MFAPTPASAAGSTAPKRAAASTFVDGETYSNPFFTDWRVCRANFPGFWEVLRQANHDSRRPPRLW